MGGGLVESLEILERLKKEFDEVEVFVTEFSSTEYELKNSKDFSKGFSKEKGCGIRVINGRRMAFGYLSLNEETPIERLVDDLKKSVVMAKEIEVDPIPDEVFEFERSSEGSLDENEAREKLNLMCEEAKGIDKRINEVKSASVSVGVSRFEVANSKGLIVKDGGVRFSASVSVLASEGNSSEMGWYSSDSSTSAGIDFKHIAIAAATDAVNKLHGGQVSTKKYSITIKNTVFTEILSHFFPIFSAYSVLHHTTALEGKLTQRVFSDIVNLVDSLDVPGRPNCFMVDHEGNKRKDTFVVRDGILESFLTDTYSARRLGIKPTPNAKRSSWKALPGVGAFNFHLKPGSKSRTQLLNKIDGIYVTEVMGLHMANTISGDFSVGIEGFLMHNGEPVSYFKSATLGDNFYEMMKRVIDISDNMYFYGPFGSPDISIADCVVGG